MCIVCNDVHFRNSLFCSNICGNHYKKFLLSDNDRGKESIKLDGFTLTIRDRRNIKKMNTITPHSNHREKNNKELTQK